MIISEAADTGVDCSAPWSSFGKSHAGLADRLRELMRACVWRKPGRELAGAARQLQQEMLEHHEEEEKHLFPAVLQSADSKSERDRIRRDIDELTAAHRRLETHWEQLLSGSACGVTADRLAEFATSYSAHAQFEEQHWLPLARSVLERNPDHVLALGAALHMRRATPPLAYW